MKFSLKSLFYLSVMSVCSLFLFSSLGFAEEAISAGDTAWVLTSAALVLLMTPGLAFFYGGLVRRKNYLSVLMQCFICLSLMSMQWLILGYSLSFGGDIGGFIGNFDFLFLKNVMNTNSGTVPHSAFMMFQGMFAIITPALIIGAFAERMKFAAFCVFAVLWTTFVYDPVCHWVWGGGFIASWGALDFAGGTVVHINAGIAALVMALMLGKRKGYPNKISPPHNLPFAILGASLLWFGWFGFNAGSALGAGHVAANALVATHMAAAAAGLAWCLIEWKRDGHPTALGMITGVVAGLVAITPAAGFVSPVDAVWIGIGSAVICYIFVAFIKTKFGYDDSLDAFGVHGIGGVWGALATGLWASTEVNPDGANGLFYGNPGLFWIQIKATLVTIVYALIVTYVIAKIVDKVIGLRVSDDSERIGLDLTEHRETAYTTLD